MPLRRPALQLWSHFQLAPPGEQLALPVARLEKTLKSPHMQGGQDLARQVLRLLPASHHIKGTLKTHVVHVVFFF